LFFLARDEATTDRWLSARAHYEEAAALARELKQLTALAGALAGLAWLDALEGREEDCRRHAKSSMSLNGAYRMGFFDIWALMALGELELGSGTPEAAAKHLEACAEQLSERGIGGGQPPRGAVFKGGFRQGPAVCIGSGWTQPGDRGRGPRVRGPLRRGAQTP
jgi:hypothetical protein